MSGNTLDPASLHILDMVRTLGLGVGARLPSERRLAARLGWSRNTVREALAGLAAQGLVEIRPCSGAYVCAGACPQLSPDDPTPLHNAAEALGLIAPALAASTCALCGGGELTRLEASTMRMGQALVDNSLINVWRGLMAFYHELTALGGNPLALGFLDTLENTALPPGLDARIPPALGQALQPFFSAHIELLHALRNQDPEGSAAQAANSLAAFRRFLATSLGEPGRRPGVRPTN
ncbi:MAG: hypothetical protein AUJ49_00475 [Desulfovibrionaceae bacterium CG1_02_65_16]|nr:MAG: hypothetical protein AUJ49_00475 [Desulfovibrionaceae bacterium CG1_02_65_16]